MGAGTGTGTGTSTGAKAAGPTPDFIDSPLYKDVEDTSTNTTTLKANSGLDYDTAATGVDLDHDGHIDTVHPRRLKYGEMMQYSVAQLAGANNVDFQMVNGKKP